MRTITCNLSFAGKSATVLMLRALEHRCGGVIPDLILDCLWTFTRIVIPKLESDGISLVKRGFECVAADTLSRRLRGVNCSGEVVSLPMDDLEEVPTFLPHAQTWWSSYSMSNDGILFFTLENADKTRCMNVSEDHPIRRKTAVVPNLEYGCSYPYPITREGWLFRVCDYDELYAIEVERGKYWRYITTLDLLAMGDLDIDFATSDAARCTKIQNSE